MNVLEPRCLNQKSKTAETYYHVAEADMLLEIRIGVGVEWFIKGKFIEELRCGRHMLIDE